MKQNKQLRDTEEKTFEGSGPLPRTKTASNSCYKAASFAQAEPSSHEGNRRASPGAQVLNSGCDTEPRGVLQKPRGFYARAQPRAAALTSGSLASPVGWKGRCRPRHSAARAAWRQHRGENAGEKVGKVLGFSIALQGYVPLALQVHCASLDKGNLLSFHCQVKG